MTHAVLYKYISCTDDKLLAPPLVTNYITIVKYKQQQQCNNNNNNNNNNNMILIISFC